MSFLLKDRLCIKNNQILHTGIIQFYLKKRGFGYIRIPETGEEYHFSEKNLTEDIEDKDQVEFELKKTKHGFYAANIRKV